MYSLHMHLKIGTADFSDNSKYGNHDYLKILIIEILNQKTPICSFLLWLANNAIRLWDKFCSALCTIN